jgi:hypothetical protein
MIIYLIENIKDGKCYVGQSIKNSIKGRYHGNWWNCSGNKHLKNAYKKHGKECFKESILKDGIESEKKLNELELFYIKKYNCVYPNGYNYQEGGQYIRLRKHNALSVKRMVINYTKGKIFKLLNNRSGIIYSFCNKANFCRENNVGRPMIVCVISGKKRSYKGWTRIDDPLNHYVLKNKDGREEDVLEWTAKAWCRKVGLCSASFFNIIHGNVKTSRSGWSLSRVYKTQIVGEIELDKDFMTDNEGNFIFPFALEPKDNPAPST